MSAEGPIYVAGHRGMVGSAVLRTFGPADGPIITRDRAALDLRDQGAVERFFAAERPSSVYLCAATVGGILANDTEPATFLHDNLTITTNVVGSAVRHGVRRLLFLGSSCIYPRLAPQPMAEEALLTGPLEPTNEAYAIAKIAGLKLCEAHGRQSGGHGIFDVRALMPTNLYGPGDRSDPNRSHVIPGLLRRFHEAHVADRPTVTVWGTGRPLREFLHVDDLAAACRHVMAMPAADLAAVTTPTRRHLNVGSGVEITIADLARLIARVVGYTGRIVFDPACPDGAPRKLLDCRRLLATGWRPTIALEDGLRRTYREILDRLADDELQQLGRIARQQT